MNQAMHLSPEEHNSPNIFIFRKLYEDNIALLIRFAERYVALEIAEDLVQDVFLEIWRRDLLTAKDINRSYLLAAVHNRCITHLNREKLRKLYTEAALQEAKLSHIANGMDDTERQRWYKLAARIELLPERCRQVFKMACFEEKCSTEIAEKLGLSVRTVEHHIYLAMKTLKKK